MRLERRGFSALGEAVVGAATRALAIVDASAALRGVRGGVAVREGAAVLAGAARGCMAVPALRAAALAGVAATAAGLRP